MSNGVNPNTAAAAGRAGSPAPDPIRAALNDIVTWSAGTPPLPTWQRDALRRLYAQQKLSASDVEELYILCRQDHDLLEEGEAPLTVQPLDASHVPANWNTGGVVALKSIGHAKNVNALADDQTLNFAEVGLTVVYGDNGAGKSGYGRVLKRACRARDQEDILTNAYATPSGMPSARIKHSVAGTAQPEVAWQDGVAASPDLSNISVFDSKCASVHVGGPNELAYTPIPLRLLQALADLVRDFAGKLKTKKGVLEGQVPSFRKKPLSRDGTAVHQFIIGLSATTQATAITSLVQMSDHETQRLEQLKRDLASDPAKEIRKLKALKQRVEELAKAVTASESVLLPAKADELRQLLVTAKDKSTAAQLAATEAFNREPLPQAGSEVWKALWEAARAFSTHEAYPDHPFPRTSDGAVCVLCQQPLSAEAATRLTAFEKFVQQKVQQAVEEARRAVQNWKDTIKRSCVTDEALAEAVRMLRDELDQPALCGKVARTLTRARVRGRKFIAATDPALVGTPQPVASIAAQLTEITGRLEERIVEFQKSSDPVQRKLQENELRSLEDRVWLAGIQSDVEAEIVRLKKIAAFVSAIQDADTNRITRKTTELSKTLVTNTIRDAFAAETIALSISDRRLELTPEPSAYGSAKFKISLVRNPKAKVASVLSEGEHRCVALAAFLAELSTAHNRSGVIFDDPVSSLDHNYRELVAARLVKEAASGRQVIVFTHDIPFLMMLDEEGRKQSQAPHYQSVNRADDRAGICVPGAPFKAKSVPDVVTKLDSRLATTTELHTNGRLDEWAEQVKAIAGILRDGWERAAEAYVAPVAQRFNNKVHPSGLRMLTILTDQDFTDLNEGYGFACTYCHTDSVALNRPVPPPAKMKDEIDRLRNWFNSVHTRQEQKK
jgi:energy-coupling factor transporter ATP-binding protein EcfA2